MLDDLIAAHARMAAHDVPVQVVVYPSSIWPLLQASKGNYPFERDGTSGYIAFGLPVFLDPECPGAVVMNHEQTKLWKAHWAANNPFGKLSLR